jgi:hypothetical protein
MKSQDKLLEEVKLYWTIQLAVVAGLGFSVENLMPTLNQGDIAGLIKLITVGISISLFGLIGMAYNMLGGYFIFSSRKRMENESNNNIYEDENEHKQSIMTPIINFTYIIIAAAIWMNICFGVKSVYPSITSCFFTIIVASITLSASLIFYLTGRATYCELADRNDKYRKYSDKLASFYLKK